MTYMTWPIRDGERRLNFRIFMEGIGCVCVCVCVCDVIVKEAGESQVSDSDSWKYCWVIHWDQESTIKAELEMWGEGDDKISFEHVKSHLSKRWPMAN